MSHMAMPKRLWLTIRLALLLILLSVSLERLHIINWDGVLWLLLSGNIVFFAFLALLESRSN